MSRNRGFRLGPRQRMLAYVVLLLVAGSGFAWIGLGWTPDAEDFNGPVRLWRHRILVLHGSTAYLLLWFAGTLFPRHQYGAWQARRNRLSGACLSLALLALALGGLVLYYPPREDWRDALSVFHQGLGLALLVLVPVHVRAGRLAAQQARLASHDRLAMRAVAAIPAAGAAPAARRAVRTAKAADEICQST
jgi:hypothetical protein